MAKEEKDFDSQIDELKESLKPLRQGPIPDSDFLSSGSTVLNLACSDRACGGFPKGCYILIVGDAASGKSILSLTCLAEAARNEEFADYRFIYDGSEYGALMDISKFFGSRMASRLEPPATDKTGEPAYSNTVETFFYNVDSALAEETPFIYILDSFDGLTSDQDTSKFQEAKEAFEKGKEVSGTFAMSKPKYASQNFPRVIDGLRKSGSILIIISQTRDNIGFGSQFSPKTRSGGHALRFYAHLELWSSIRDHIKKTVNGKPRQIGITCKVQIKKNRVTGRETAVEMPIYWQSGFADVDSCIDYLISESHWNETKGKIEAPEFDFTGSHEKLVELIESEDREHELSQLVQKVWLDIRERCAVKRKQRYE